jgi:hypothetical protein
MANDDIVAARGGLLPVGFPFGNYKKNLYRLTTSATAAVFIGQPMDLDSNGRVVPAGTGDNPILGPALGFLDTNKAGLPSAMTSLSQGGYLPSNTDAYVIVCDDPNQEYMLQEDTGGSALVEGNIGNNGSFIYRTSSGNTTTGYSTAELDRSTVTTGTAGALRVVGLHDYVNSDGTNNGWGNYGKIRVKIAYHRAAFDKLSAAI